jgi:trehalose synthase
MVAEAMWKGKPVIGGFAGGITVQLIYEVTGYTVNSVEGCAFRIRHLLNHPEQAEQMGRDAAVNGSLTASEVKRRIHVGIKGD